MGVSYDPYATYGLKIPYSEIRSLEIKEVPSCDHVYYAMAYCPFCGVKAGTKKDFNYTYADYVEFDEDEFPVSIKGFELIDDNGMGDPDFAYIGLHLQEGESASPCEIIEMETKLREAFKDHELCKDKSTLGFHCWVRVS